MPRLRTPADQTMRLVNPAVLGAVFFVTTPAMLCGLAVQLGLELEWDQALRFGVAGLLVLAVILFAATPIAYDTVFAKHGGALPEWGAGGPNGRPGRPKRGEDGAPSAAWLYPAAHPDLGLLLLGWYA